MNLNEAEGEVLHLRDALLRSEAELEMEREMRRLTEKDNALERQLRYQVHGEIEPLVIRAVDRVVLHNLLPIMRVLRTGTNG